MSEAKMYPARDPTYIPENSLDFDKCEFHSKVFRISEIEGMSQNDEYMKLMESMFPYDPASNLQLNPMGNAITKTWTKDGDLLVHVEYIEMIREEEDTADNHEF
ncbi:MAG: hypothetical protein GWN86_00925 [Desulfobacterales bacterium]|nr:hypothetical protein [Desulfobacterales bacterium]